MSSTKVIVRADSRLRSRSKAESLAMGLSFPKIESSVNLGKELGHQIVTVTVGEGPEAKVFALHKALLCSKAMYFKNMFMGGFDESFTNCANFPEDNPAAFELFVSWLYLDAVQIPEDSPKVPAFEVLIHLYAFAEKCVIIRLADQTMDVLTGLMYEREGKLEPSHMKLAYDLTPQYSNLRTFIAKMCVYILLEADEDTNDLSWSSASVLTVFKGYDDLLLDIFTMMRGKSGKTIRDPRLAPDCEYHFHAADSECPYEFEKSPISSSGLKKRASKKIVTPSPKKRCSRK